MITFSLVATNTGEVELGEVEWLAPAVLLTTTGAITLATAKRRPR